MRPHESHWTLGASADQPGPATDVMVEATYRLTGAAEGAPRAVTYWRLGDRLRAEQAGRLVWLEGPAGGHVIVRLPEGGLARVSPGQLLPHVPAPELEALAGAEQAAAWLDVPGEPAACASGLHEGTGRPSLLSTWSDLALRVVTDEYTGCVLDLTADGLRGQIAIRTTDFALLPPDPERFLQPDLD